MRTLLAFSAFVLMSVTPLNAGDIYPPVPTIGELAAYILAHQQSPEGYVVSKFKDHDVIFLGESHRIRHDAELVQRLIPRCYQNGIRVLALEFANRSDQALIDSLLALPTYVESIARRVTFNEDQGWAYQEYLDLYKSAWTLNASLPKESARFRIIGVNCTGDWSVMRSQEDMQNDSLRRLVWQRCPGGEVAMAEAVLKQVRNGEKVLVYSGMHHAFTRFLQPVVDGQGKFTNFNPDQRMAQGVYMQLGSRAFSISLHYPWYGTTYDSPQVRPVNGTIDSVMKILGDKFRPVGFDVQGSPFGLLPDSRSLYHAGYADFRLQEFCDGYIFQRPFSQYEVVHFVEDFINPSNFAEFQKRVASPWYRDKSLERSKTSFKRQLERELKSYRDL